MKKTLCFALLAVMAAAAFADAGQFRISRPHGPGRRRPPPGRRDSVLEITNNDDRGYAIDVDYRRNRLTFAHRSGGDIYLPGDSSRISLAFDDDDDWRIEGDHETLEIKMRDGRTTRLTLETRTSRNRIGLFGTVDDGRQRTTAQLFRYADRPGRPNGHRPPPRPTPPPPPPSRPAPPRKDSLGAAIGNIIDNLVDDDRPGRRR
ncbi:MAG: hypothetical protein LBT97_13095 [Planctomycetota bacterium]|jgi:hypothetical protein|nr:hypothetical protein [Planctomycetota bacterium]